jgi:hypothetical protein
MMQRYKDNDEIYGSYSTREWWIQGDSMFLIGGDDCTVERNIKSTTDNSITLEVMNDCHYGGYYKGQTWTLYDTPSLAKDALSCE